MQNLEKKSLRTFRKLCSMGVKSCSRDSEKEFLTMHTKKCLYFDVFIFLMSIFNGIFIQPFIYLYASIYSKIE